jgi:ferredoxin-NADP reductase
VANEFVVKIREIQKVTHDVKRFVVDKPKGYKFIPGQATLVSVNKPGWISKKHEFTFTSLTEDSFLEFTIKGYPVMQFPDHEGVTELIHKLKIGDELVIEDPFGTINYKGSGVFIAGGAGITPFLAIFKELNKKNTLKGNKLIFSNKTSKDVIFESWLKKIFPKEDLILTLTREKKTGYYEGRVDENFLEKHINDFETNFYLCGPGKMVKSLKETLSKHQSNTGSIVFEE